MQSQAKYIERKNYMQRCFTNTRLNNIEIKEVNFHVPKRKMGEKSRGEVP